MTNKEWLNSVTTKEQAKWLANTCRSVASEYYHENQNGSWSADYWEKWLEEEHTKKQGVKED